MKGAVAILRAPFIWSRIDQGSFAGMIFQPHIYQYERKSAFEKADNSGLIHMAYSHLAVLRGRHHVMFAFYVRD